MRVATREVYHCEHCSKYLLRRHAMEYHEDRCTRNPARICKVCGCRWPETMEVERIKGEMESGAEFCRRLWIEREECPLCMLAILIQNNVTPVEGDFDYEKEYKRYMEDQYSDRGY